MKDPYSPAKHCDFETCTLEIFESELAEIRASGGGDEPESLLSASFHVMEELNWKYGSTKSLVILTDAGFLSPDRDGISFDEVVRLSKQIDPVNFYVITNRQYGEEYAELALATDGDVVTNFDELSLLTNRIMERYDSLPRVEEAAAVEDLPTLVVNEVTTDGNQVRIDFTTDGPRVLVVLNDAIMGAVEVDARGSVTIGEMDWTISNVVNLIPVGEDLRGEAVEIRLNEGYGGAYPPNNTAVKGSADAMGGAWSPKTPNTGHSR